MSRAVPNAFTGASLLLDAGIRDQLRLAWRLLQDKRVSSIKYALPALVTLYVAAPIDPIPDFLLGIGQLDDVGIVVAAMMLLTRILPRLAPGHVVQEHLEAMGKAHDVSPPRSRPNHEIVDASFRVRGEG